MKRVGEIPIFKHAKTVSDLQRDNDKKHQRLVDKGSGNGVKRGKLFLDILNKTDAKKFVNKIPITPVVTVEHNIPASDDTFFFSGESDFQQLMASTSTTIASQLKVARAEKQLRDKENTSTWKKRAIGEEADWAAKRPSLLKKVVAFEAFHPSICRSCREQTSIIVNCITCRKHLCFNCDKKVHSNLVFCDRETHIPETGALVRLEQNEFLNEKFKIERKDVTLPLYVTTCKECKSELVECIPGDRPAIVVTPSGRFDITSSAFKCEGCGYQREADTDDYVISGFWPGIAVDGQGSYFISRELLLPWYHLQHLAPGVSRNKFIETFESVSNEFNRNEIINPTMFDNASREYDYLRYRIDVDIKKIDNMTCKACGDDPLACHCDGNMKIFRLKSANDHGTKSLYEGVAIAKDTEVDNFVSQVNHAIPVSHGHGTCGSSTFKAGKSDSSSSSYKKLDETGLLSICCRHGTILRMANMYRGETYRIVAYLHNFAANIRTKFFCYDVICKYWPFVQKLGRINSIFKRLSDRMLPFLSRFHGKAHQWLCQVMWYGHWRKGAAATLGEEHEQVFATVSKYGTVIRHMTKANRENKLTQMALYHNRKKDMNMVSTLKKRLITAQKRVPVLKSELEQMLIDQNKTKIGLPAVATNLLAHAQLMKDKRLTQEWDLQHLQRELEGVTLAMKTLQTREMKNADGCKARNRHRKTIANLKMRAKSLIELINAKPGAVFVTEEDRITGFFPWQNSSDGFVSVADDFKVVDVWMLLKRFQEEIPQTRKEMKSFYLKISKDILNLSQDINALSVSQDAFDKGSIIIKSKEIERLQMILAEATIQFDAKGIDNQDPAEDCLSFQEVEDDTELIGGTFDEDHDAFKIADGYIDSECDDDSEGDEGAHNFLDTQTWLDLDD